MKHLFNYNSKNTLGTLKGNERVNEKTIFNEFYNVTKDMLVEVEDEYGDKKKVVKDEYKPVDYKGCEIVKSVKGGYSYVSDKDGKSKKAETIDEIKKMIDTEKSKSKVK
jgi:hypothetical protein